MPSRTLIATAIALAMMAASATTQLSFEPPPAASAGELRFVAVAAESSEVPRFGKFELTINLENVAASQPEFPYDPSPPPGVRARVGISVEGLFLPPGQSDWGRAIRRPAFLYQPYERREHEGVEWLHPSGDAVWKIRFAPPSEGAWRYRVRAQDASICPSGVSPCHRWTDGGEGHFTVGPARPSNRGFVEVSPRDPRYFAFPDGSLFAGVGHNTSFDPANFTFDAEAQLRHYAAHGVDFLRTWMTGSPIAGSSWSPWVWFGGPWYGGYLPDPALAIAPPGSGSDYVIELTKGISPIERTCVFNGWIQGPIPVKPGTTYRLATTVRVDNLAGPLNPSSPDYGFTIKLGPWPDGCPEGLSGEPNLIPYIREGGWRTQRSSITTGPEQHFLDGFLFLTLDNVSRGQAFVKEVSLREVLPGGGLGPEVLTKSRSDAHLDFNPARSWAWDHVMDTAADLGVYLKLVVLEKHDRVWNFFALDGTMSAAEDEEERFYAAEGTAVRRLHEYYWRYLAARWGHATAIHSWELLNEGNPYSTAHYAQADAFGRHLRRWGANQMVTTSFWHSYPVDEFWANPAYPHLSYADLHSYTDTGTVPASENDAAGFYLAYADYVGRFRLDKPTVRGETGITDGSGGEAVDLVRDLHGVWLHNLTWARLHPSGLYDLYWWRDTLVENDLYFRLRYFRDFLADIPLAHGGYADAAPVVSHRQVRAVGQIDRVAGRAHLWIQNRNHTWRNVVDGADWGRLRGTVTVSGFAPNVSYTIEMWRFDSPGNLSISRSDVSSDGSGRLALDLSRLPAWVTDVAVKVEGPGLSRQGYIPVAPR